MCKNHSNFWEKLLLSPPVALNCITGFPDSQQPTGSYITRICLGIYRKVGKTGKMHINSNVRVHTS